MSGRPLKCYGWCGEKYPREEIVKVGSKNYCKKCGERKQKEIKDREVLFHTIQITYNIPYPSGQMLRQIKQFKEDRNYDYEGMTKTLCYFIKVIKKKPFLNAALSFLPYYYDSAIKYYKELDERREKAKDIVENEVKHIVIGPIKHDTSYKEKKMIKMEDVLNDK